MFEGALMKGQAIHDISAECLIKYLLMKKFKVDKDENHKILYQ